MKSYRLSAFVILLFSVGFQVKAQLSTDPAVPSADQSIKITYDATKGTTGLTNCNCDVYIHIGAVTEGPESTVWSIVPFTWGTADSNAKMTKVEGEDNLFTFELTPTTFFDNPTDATIYRLGVVFRNATGSLEGKTTLNGDFFIDLAQGFTVAFTSPANNQVSLEVGEQFDFIAETSTMATLSFELDGNLVASKPDATSLTYTYTATEAGTFTLEAKATAGDQMDTESVSIDVFSKSETAALPPGIQLGINYQSDTEAVLALQAPGKRIVHVLGEFNDWQILPEYQMKRSPDGEIFWLAITGLVPGEEYLFQYLVDASIRIGDPYADKVSDPFHDQEIIDQGRYPGLKPYPQGKTEFQASYLQTAQEPFAWKHPTYTKISPEKLVIYELLVRDFDDKRTYQAVIDRLDYLENLGVNAIQLMPIGEFEGNLSWGYNPSFFFAPDKFYGTKNELKQLIDEAHGRGMMVILDMVLNHAFGQNPLVRLYNEGDYGAPTPDNPWFNPTARHPFNVGYDFNHESSYTAAFVDSVNSYWLTEYKVDGFRFDLSKGFTQVNSGSDVGLWSQYDPSRIKIWKHIYDQIKSRRPEAYVILEHLSDNEEEKELAAYGMLFWGNMNFDFREMAKGENKDFGWGYHGNRGWNAPRLIAYQESHDEERVMWESLTFGKTSPLNLRNLENAVNRNQLLTAFYFGLPGPKMLWQFGEFGYDEELNNDRLGIKPTRWNYLDDPQRLRLFKLYQEMIKLKKELDVLTQPDKVTLNLSGAVKHILLEHTSMDLVLYGNFGLTNSGNVSLSFPYTGTWYNYFTGEEFEVSSTSMTFNLRPSEFYLFTSQPLPKPEAGIVQEDFVTALPREKLPPGSFKIYPNPTSDRLTVVLPKGMEAIHYRIIDLAGRVHLSGTKDQIFVNLDFDLTHFHDGIYIFEAFDTKRVLHQRFIKR